MHLGGQSYAEACICIGNGRKGINEKIEMTNFAIKRCKLSGYYLEWSIKENLINNERYQILAQFAQLHWVYNAF